MFVMSFQNRAQSEGKLSNAKWKFLSRDVNITLHFTNCLFWRVSRVKKSLRVGVTDNLLSKAQSWRAAALSNKLKLII